MMHTAESYAAEWATLTGRPASQVYVPVALRTVRLALGGKVFWTAAGGRRVEGTIIQLGTETVSVRWVDGDVTTEDRYAFNRFGELGWSGW